VIRPATSPRPAFSTTKARASTLAGSARRARNTITARVIDPRADNRQTTRYQHLTPELRRDVAEQVGGLLWEWFRAAMVIAAEMSGVL
jgi:hypothetical protein